MSVSHVAAVAGMPVKTIHNTVSDSAASDDGNDDDGDGEGKSGEEDASPVEKEGNEQSSANTTNTIVTASVNTSSAKARRRPRPQYGREWDDYTIFYVGEEGPRLRRVLVELNRSPCICFSPRVNAMVPLSIKVRVTMCMCGGAIRCVEGVVKRAIEEAVVGEVE